MKVSEISFIANPSPLTGKYEVLTYEKTPEPGTASDAISDVVKVWLILGVSLYHWLKFAWPVVVADDRLVSPFAATS